MNLNDLIQKDGVGKTGATVTNYTKKTNIPAQVLVPNKNPMHSRTQPANTSVKLPK